MGVKQRARFVICASVATMVIASAAWSMDGRSLSTPQMERYDRLTHQLIAPCCWREPIAIHRSPEALQMLDEVEQFVAQGRSEEEIKAIYVSRYGVRILADPPGVQGQWLYTIPVVLFACAVFGAIWFLRAFVFKVTPTRHSAPPELIARVRLETGNE